MSLRGWVVVAALATMACSRRSAEAHPEITPDREPSAATRVPPIHAALVDAAAMDGPLGDALAVSIEADGSLTVDGVQMVGDGMAARHATIFGRKRAILVVDSAVPYARVVAVLDLLTKAGVTDVSFQLLGTDASVEASAG